ncbi:MAG: endonuclease domain-containing protein [Balneolaceae bacterium]
MARNTIIPYNPQLRVYARELRNNSTLSEILLWKEIKNRKLGVQFHRQVPMYKYIADFFCHEIKLAIEIDGSSHNNPRQKEKDRMRDYNLKQFGVRVIRIEDIDVKRNLNSVIGFLQARVKERILEMEK